MARKRNYDSKGHVWQTTEYGVDIFAYSPSEYCNGPRCIHCGYGFCHHCIDEPATRCKAEDNYLSHDEYIEEIEGWVPEDELVRLKQRRL